MVGALFVVGCGLVVYRILDPSETALSISGGVEMASPSETMVLVLSDPVGSSHSRDNVCCFSSICSELFSRRGFQLGGGVDDCRYGTVDFLSNTTWY